MKIHYADLDQDFEFLKEKDHLISPEILQQKLEQGKIIITKDEKKTVGWLRFGFFWDLLPIMNMLMIEESYRGKGWGTKLVGFWEAEMKKRGYNLVMTSTLSDEQAQHFYRKLGYKDAGALLLPDEALEIILIKKLS
jgi:ribosomal protein S18 acetylase RimI-like enzyme